MQVVMGRPPRGSIAVKRAAECCAANDGLRVLVDRHWPPGLSKERLAVDLWLRDAAPSEALRRWYGRDPSRWPMFVSRYRAELAHHAGLLRLLDELGRRGPVTLVCGARDALRNNAVVLRNVLAERHPLEDSSKERS